MAAAKLRAMPEILKHALLSENNYHMYPMSDECAWIGEFSYKNRRLIASYKKSRAQRDAKQQEQIVQKITKILGADGDTKKVITNNGVKKFTTTRDSITTLRF